MRKFSACAVVATVRRAKPDSQSFISILVCLISSAGKKLCCVRERMQQSGVLRVAHPHRHGGIVILSIALLFSILLNDLVHQGQPLLWRIDHVQRLFHLLFADAVPETVGAE